MEKVNQYKQPLLKKECVQKEIIFPENPGYPVDEDLYAQSKEEKEIDPEQISNTKQYAESGSNNEKDFEDDVTGEDLDVTGSELDDNQEEIGSEDEENNYYSLGGDNHDD
jgi:hypothetical protein